MPCMHHFKTLHAFLQWSCGNLHYDIFVRDHNWFNMYMYIYVYIYIYAYIHICPSTYVCLCVCAYGWYTDTCMHVGIFRPHLPCPLVFFFLCARIFEVIVAAWTFACVMTYWILSHFYLCVNGSLQVLVFILTQIYLLLFIQINKSAYFTTFCLLTYRKLLYVVLDKNTLIYACMNIESYKVYNKLQIYLC